jgi:hypothetical protein
VLELVPRGSEAELEPPARDVVDGGGLVREDGGVTIGDADDDHPDPEPARVRGHGREQGHALEAGARRIGVNRQEVVEGRRPVEAERLRVLPEAHVAGKVGVLLTRVDAEAEAHGETLSDLSDSAGLGARACRVRPRRGGQPEADAIPYNSVAVQAFCATEQAPAVFRRRRRP